MTRRCIAAQKLNRFIEIRFLNPKLTRNFAPVSGSSRARFVIIWHRKITGRLCPVFRSDRPLDRSNLGDCSHTWWLLASILLIQPISTQLLCKQSQAVYAVPASPSVTACNNLQAAVPFGAPFHCTVQVDSLYLHMQLKLCQPWILPWSTKPELHQYQPHSNRNAGSAAASARGI